MSVATKMLGLVSWLALFSLVSARAGYPETKNINRELDELFEKMSIDLTRKGFGKSPIQDILYNRLQLSQGWFIGWNSQKRTGDCWSTKFQNGTLVLDTRDGLDLAVVNFNRVALGGDLSTVTVISPRSSKRTVSITDLSNCKVNIPVYELEGLEWAVFQYPKPARSPFNSLDLKAELNKFLLSDKPVMEKILSDMCKEGKPPAELPTLYTRTILSRIPQLLKKLPSENQKI